MITYKTLLNLKRLALSNVLFSDTTVDGIVEKAYRHYSKTYFTPLLDAKKTLTQEEVILIYFEDDIAESTPDQIADLRKSLNPTDRPVLELSDVEEVDDANSDEAWIASENAKLKKAEAEKAEEMVKKANEAIDKFKQTLSKLPKLDEENKE